MMVLSLAVASFDTPLYAQTSPNSNWFKMQVSIDNDTPQWARMMYGEDPNVFEVTDAYDKYFEKNEWQKDVHVRNYIYWLQSTEDFVNADGFIRPPTLKEQQLQIRKLQQKQQKASSSRSRSNIWKAIGPFETIHAPSNTPTTRQANIFELDQSNSQPNILYAATELGGIYKSIDRGLNWTSITHTQPFAGPYGAMEIHPANPDIVIAVSKNFIFRTSDGGRTWAQVGNLGNRQKAYDLKFKPSNPDSLFLVASNGLYQSVNGGTTWTKSSNFMSHCRDIDFHPTNSNIIYLLQDNATAKRTEFHKSTDGGATWVLKDNGYFRPQNDAQTKLNGGKIAVTPANPNRVYVVLVGDGKAGDNGWIGLIRSDNSGENWTNPSGQYGSPYQASNTMPWNIAAYSATSKIEQGYYNLDLEVSPTNADLVWVGTIRLSESSNGGVSFVSIGGASSTRENRVHADIQDIEVGSNGELWIANDGGIDYSNNNGQTFSARTKGINGSTYWGFDTGWNEDFIVGGRFHNGNGAYHQSYATGQSTVLGRGEDATGYVHPMDSRLAYFGIYNNPGETNVRIAPTAPGQRYTQVSKWNFRPNESFLEANSSGIYFDPRYANHMYVGVGSTIRKSTDNGGDFRQLYDFGAGARTLEMAISRNNPDYIYAVVKPNGTNARLIYRSTNGGTIWTALTNIPANRNALNITLNPENENEIWVTANYGVDNQKVYRSINAGTTWTNMTTTALDGEHPYDILYQGGTNNLVYLATQTSVFYYNQSTNNWVRYKAGLPIVPQVMRMGDALSPFYRDNKLRLGTAGWGIWEVNLAQASRPLAQPMTHTDSIFCSRDTVQFDCHSMLNHRGATWRWTITPTPTWISSRTARKPKVVFGNDGNYTVSLSVTQGGRTNSKTITNMVAVQNRCDIESFAARALDVLGTNNSNVLLPPLNLNSNRVTISAWINPDKVHTEHAGIVFCRAGTTVSGIRLEANTNNQLVYEWNRQHYGWNSGATIPVNQWSHVALVIEPNRATLYLNGRPYVNTVTHDVEPFDGNTYIGYDQYLNRNWAFDGQIDEVCIWNRSLTQNEIQATMRQTKSRGNGLVAYYQFNETTNPISDKAGTHHGIMRGTATTVVSTVPLETSPQAPSVPAATAATNIQPTGFTANWGTASGSTSYRIDVSRDNFNTYEQRDVTVNSTNQVVTGLTAVTTYQYRVRAVNAVGTSGNSNVITVTTPIPAPRATAATNIQSTGFTANWNAVNGSTSYRLDVSTACLLYTSPSPRDATLSRMPSSA